MRVCKSVELRGLLWVNTSRSFYTWLNDWFRPIAALPWHNFNGFSSNRKRHPEVPFSWELRDSLNGSQAR